jgi:hypothetical protein
MLYIRLVILGYLDKVTIYSSSILFSAIAFIKNVLILAGAINNLLPP